MGAAARFHPILADHGADVTLTRGGCVLRPLPPVLE